MRRFPRLGARLYDLLARLILGSMYRRVALEIAAAVDHGEVLDVGTGPGRLPLELAHLAPTLHITGVDPAQGMIEVALRNARKLNLASRVSFLTGDVTSLPVPDGSFDMVVSTLSLHHWRNQVEGVAELHRVMRPGGMAWIYDLDSPAIRQGFRELAGLSPFGEYHMGRLTYSRWMHPGTLLKVEMR